MEPEKKATRFVTKYEYANVQARRLYLTASSLWFKALGGFCGAIAFGVFLLVMAGYSRFWAIGVTTGLATFLLLKLFVASDKKLKSLEKVVLIPYANTADLPADESLVRASQEPVQEQQSILLRPAMAADASPPEQLLRSANDR